MAGQAKFDITRDESDIITMIVTRAHAEVYTAANGWSPEDQDRLATMMGITACHRNGCALDLQKLLDAPAFDFAHDIVGIRRHINRETGEIMNCFLPRCAAREDEHA